MHYIINIPGIFKRGVISEKTKEKYSSDEVKFVTRKVEWLERGLDFPKRLVEIEKEILDLHRKGNTVSLLGTSAGGSVAMNILVDLPGKIEKMVLICAPVRQTETPLIKLGEEVSPASGESLATCDEKLSKLSKEERGKILIVEPKMDELVPLESMQVSGAKKLRIPTVEHLISI